MNTRNTCTSMRARDPADNHTAQVSLEFNSSSVIAEAAEQERPSRSLDDLELATDVDEGIHSPVDVIQTVRRRQLHANARLTYDVITW